MNEKLKSIVVTGASGFVGSLLVPRLLAAGCRLLLVGRSPDVLIETYPGVKVCTYEELAAEGHGFDMLVHLAGVHAGYADDEETTKKANVELPVSVARSAAAARIPVMLYRCSTHALNLQINSAYARSKREAVEQLGLVQGIEIRIVYMPLIYGDRWKGRLSLLNLLPGSVARPLFFFMAVFKPTCHIETLKAFILSDLPGGSSILSDRQMNNPVYSGIVRLIDLVFAIAVATLLGWLLVLVWILIRLSSPGPGIFAQLRIGRGGRKFVCYKFRTMKQGTPHAGTHEVSAASVTQIGKFLRKTKIDELPQIVNIFRDELSLIGPRPCLPTQEELIEERRIRGVLDIKPGISGLAQINQIDMSDPLRLAIWDAKYLGLRSVILDLEIALATATGRGQGDKTAVDC